MIDRAAHVGRYKPPAGGGGGKRRKEKKKKIEAEVDNSAVISGLARVHVHLVSILFEGTGYFYLVSFVFVPVYFVPDVLFFWGTEIKPAFDAFDSVRAENDIAEILLLFQLRRSLLLTSPRKDIATS